MKEYFEQEGRRVTWLLVEIERQTADRLSEESQRRLLEEVACHLDAAIQARLELGQTPIEAEWEAVQSFGHPADYIDDLLQVHEEAQALPSTRVSILKGDPRTMSAFWALTVSGSIWLLVGPKNVNDKVVLAGMLVLAVVFAYYSFKSKRFQPVPLAIRSLLSFGVLVICFNFTWLNLWAHGGQGYIPRWQASSIDAGYQRDLANLDRLMLSVKRGIDLHAKYPYGLLSGASASEVNELKDIPSLDGFVANRLTPPLGVPGREARIVYTQGIPPAETQNYWTTGAKDLYDDLEAAKTRASNDLAAIATARAQPPFADFTSNFESCAPCLGLWLALTGAINFLFGTLGWAVSLSRKSRRRRVA